MTSRVQQLAEKQNLTSNDFIGEMRKRGCSEPTAVKIWLGLYEGLKILVITTYISAISARPPMF